MTEQQTPATASTARLAQVESTLDSFATSVAREHPHRADAVRVALDRLRDRLRHAHQQSHDVDESAWAEYVVELERGLDELQIEIARAAEPADAGPTLDDLLYKRTTALELSGWRLRVDAARTRPEWLVQAARELTNYERASHESSDGARANLERAMAQLRGALD